MNKLITLLLSLLFFSCQTSQHTCNLTENDLKNISEIEQSDSKEAIKHFFNKLGVEIDSLDKIVTGKTGTYIMADKNEALKILEILRQMGIETPTIQVLSGPETIGL